jgi:hypothetical protein
MLSPINALLDHLELYFSRREYDDIVQLLPILSTARHLCSADSAASSDLFQRPARMSEVAPRNAESRCFMITSTGSSGQPLRLFREFLPGAFLSLNRITLTAPRANAAIALCCAPLRYHLAILKVVFWVFYPGSRVSGSS